MKSDGISFARLHDLLVSNGCQVGVCLNEGRHLIRVTDPEADRVLQVPVEGGFDRTATVLVLGAALRELTATPSGPSNTEVGSSIAWGSWPEIAELAARMANRGAGADG